MHDNANILSRCAKQLLLGNHAQACLAFMVTDNSISFVCDPDSNITHLQDNLSLELIDEISDLQRVFLHVEFSSREETFIAPETTNPLGIIISGSNIKNLRVVPICDSMLAYSVVVLINVDESKNNNNRVNVQPFVVATANLFNIKQNRHNSALGTVLKNIFHPVIFFNKSLEITNYNKHSMAMVQRSNMKNSYSMSELLDYFSPEIAKEIKSGVEDYATSGRLNKTDWRNIPFKQNDRESIQVDARLVPLLDNNAINLQSKQHNVHIASDVHFALMINDNKRNQMRSLQRFQALTSLIPLGILQLTSDYKCLYANVSWSKITSLTKESSLENGWTKCFESRDLHKILPEMKRFNLENREYSQELKIKTESGSTKWLSLKSVGLFNDTGELDGFIITLDDVTQVHEQKVVLENLANTDSLTGISNRSAFHDRLSVAISRVARHDNAAVMFLDLDKFKAINDAYGHHAGDIVIQNVAQRLNAIVRAEDTIARIGGDEFAIIVSDFRSDADVINLAIKIIVDIAKPMIVEKNTLKVQCSIGIATITHSGSSVKTILKNADLAVYKAKSLGRNQFCLYTESLEREALLANYLRASLQKKSVDGFFIEYQPQVNANTNQIVGVEALSRWHHPQNQDVSPQEFIQQLETHGLINEFFVWQLNALLPLAKRWIEDGLITPTCRLSINLSAVQLHIHTFAKQLLNSFKKEGVRPDCFGLEVNETAFMQEPLSAGENLKMLREAGMHITLDDFGTGFSSLNLLRKMPLDSIKIDKEFIADILTNTTDAKIVQSMIALSRELDLNVIAEGVESDAIKEWLGTNQCHVQQGFHFYKPMPAQVLESCLKGARSLH